MSEPLIAPQSIPARKFRRLLLSVFGMAAACAGPDAQMELRSALPDPSQTYIMLANGSSVDQVLIHMATLATGDLALCLVPAATACDPNNQIAFKESSPQGSRRFFIASQEVKADPVMTYRIVKTNGDVVAGFRLVDRNADPVATGLSLVDRDTLSKELGYITADVIKGRLSATPENEAVADWLIAHLKRLGVPPASGNDYRQRFTLSVGPTKGAETANIIGLIEGSDPVLKNEYVVIGAHMDHAGTLTRGYTCSKGNQESGADDICNGADDNGSGTIALLNVIKSLVSARSSVKRSIIVMWFTGEEEGLLGSYHYVKNPVFPLEKTVYMINMDMVGYMRSFGNSLAALGGGSSSFGKAILADVAKKYPQTPVKISDKAGGGSDHVPFMAKGIPGVFLHTGVSNNPNYHKTSDSADKIDYDGMVVATKVAFETAYRVANASIRQDLNLVREPLVSEEEMKQACHHLINNPFVTQLQNELPANYSH